MTIDGWDKTHVYIDLNIDIEHVKCYRITISSTTSSSNPSSLCLDNSFMTCLDCWCQCCQLCSSTSLSSFSSSTVATLETHHHSPIAIHPMKTRTNPNWSHHYSVAILQIQQGSTFYKVGFRFGVSLVQWLQRTCHWSHRRWWHRRTVEYDEGDLCSNFISAIPSLEWHHPHHPCPLPLFMKLVKILVNFWAENFIFFKA